MGNHLLAGEKRSHKPRDWIDIVCLVYYHVIWEIDYLAPTGGEEKRKRCLRVDYYSLMNYYSSLKVDKTKLPHVYTYIYSHSNAVAVLFKKLSLMKYSMLWSPPPYYSKFRYILQLSFEYVFRMVLHENVEESNIKGTHKNGRGLSKIVAEFLYLKKSFLYLWGRE